jgi:hypothetical protein
MPREVFLQTKLVRLFVGQLNKEDSEMKALSKSERQDLTTLFRTSAPTYLNLEFD